MKHLITSIVRAWRLSRRFSAATPRALVAAFVLSVVALSQPLPALAQPHAWSLRECCDYAVAHSLAIKQQENQCRQQELQLSNAKNSRLPDLSGSVGQNFSFGRGLTADNTYSNTNTSSTSFSVGTSIPLFTGFQIPNQIKLASLNLEAATADLEKAKNDIRMQVAQAYVQILYNMEIADVARRQIAIDSAQVVRIAALVDNGKASGAQLSQQRATLAGSLLTATQADNNLALAILTLSQLLELPSPDGFTVVKPVVSEELKVKSEEFATAIPSATNGTAAANSSLFTLHSSPIPTPDAIYAEALGLKPEIVAQQLRLKASGHSIAIARAGYMPTLSLSGGLGSNYYTTSKFPSDGFSTQMKNNFSQYVGLNLNIPIFNRFNTRNSIRSAKLDQANQQLALDNTKKTLYKEIQQVCLNAAAAQAKYESSIAAAQSSADAFTLMKAKYENGKATITEFNEAKNATLRAESDLVQARYELLYQHALIQFYRGRELDL
ncbi:MAG: TolC family protein [Prevotella sp.]|jgi:outer membrane protein|nr:TolC family protein [Prevotella sp.]